MSAKKHRLTLEFDAKSMAAIDDVKKMTRLTSMSAVVHRGVVLMHMFTQHEAAGGEVFFKEKDGKPERVRVLT